MLDAIGDAAMQHSVRANHDNEMHDQELAVKKSAELRKKRPVEKTESSAKSEQDLKQEEEQTQRKNSLEDGHIVVEEYNEDGVIVRKIPPGYVLSNEMA